MTPFHPLRQPGVLIVHPDQQHSNQLAAALAGAGLLASYKCGVKQDPELCKVIGSDKIERTAFWITSRRVISRLVPSRFRLEAAHRLLRHFDRHIARMLNKSNPQAVVGYENCALETFETAKRLGILRILDVPSVHHRMQARVGLAAMRAKFQNDVNLRKDREIALADLILVCSSLARDSFVEAGVDAKRIAILPLGVDLDRFYPEPFPEDRPPSTVRFVFAGHVSAQKGVDTLVEACHELARNTIPFELVVAGSYADCERSLLEALRRYGQVIGRVPNRDLGDIYRQASCLVLPSRFDSFGQVVVEAMACGLPVIVSENVGARDLVESGKNGWVIPSKDASALYQIMAECVSNPQKLRIMAKAARKTAERTGWPVYRDRAARTIRQFLEVNAQRKEENEDLSRSGLLDLSHKSNGFGGTQMMEPSLPQRNADIKTNSDFKEVRHLFNRKATTWNQKYETGGSLAFRVSAFRGLVAHELSPNNKVLDLGCGTGAIAAALSDGGLQVTACDVAEKMIDAGRRIYKAFPIQWCLLPPDWKELPFDSGTFHGLVASSVFEYLPDVDAVLLECQRVLKPGGILIATVPSSHTLTRKFEKVVRPAAIVLDQLPGFSRIPRLHSYATYLKCSRNRMPLEDWWARGVQAHFNVKTPAQAVAPSPSLNFLVLRKTNKGE